MVTGKRTRATNQGIQAAFDHVEFNLDIDFAPLTAEQCTAAIAENTFIYKPGEVPDDETFAIDTDDTVARFYGHAPVTSVGFTTPQKYVERDEEFVNLTERELDKVAFIGEYIKIAIRKDSYELCKRYVTYAGKLSVRELIARVRDFETDRVQLDWEYGQLNLDHNFYEGLSLESNGVYRVAWGS